MPSFSPRSQSNLETLDPRLQRILNDAIKYADFSIICGYRGEEEQNEAFDNGYSKLRYPQSMHNTYPSKAVDLMPYPINWDIRDPDNLASIAHLMGFILGLATAMGIRVRWGGDWNRNFMVERREFRDVPHLELLD